MNTAVNRFATDVAVPRGMWSDLLNRQVLVAVLLALTVLVSAFSVVYVRDFNRRLFIELESAQVSQDRLQTEWGKLLLEQSTWSTQARVQQIAQQTLNMEIPPPSRVVMVRP